MDEPEAAQAGTERREPRVRGVADGIKQGIGVLSALKDALEESITEARERGDLTPERAREAVRSALGRVQEAAGGARERLELVSRKELDQLRDQVAELRVRLESLERRAAQGPEAGAERPEAGGSG